LTAWSLRLGTYLLFRLKQKYPVEDLRYTKIKVNWGQKTKTKFFWFFQFQAISQPLLGLPFLLGALSSNKLSVIDGFGVFISLVGIIGESLADSQLKNFKLKPENSGRVCELGLWRYSRHPNYFFEWVIWCGFACFGMTNSLGYLSFASPLVMFLLLNFVTGVPPAEEQSLKSKPDLYRVYQKRTSRFFPWIPNAN
jgi:steroid 5-alpha reductase family enzyme